MRLIIKEFLQKEDLLESIESKIQERYKFDIVDHDVKFYGLCEDCKK